MVEVVINGDNTTFDSPTSLAQYISSLDIDTKLIAIAYNQTVLRKEEWSSVTLDDGDRIEVGQAVGGG